jgi:hypothetical protein
MQVVFGSRFYYIGRSNKMPKNYALKLCLYLNYRPVNLS